jgi:hypothetical protein
LQAGKILQYILHLSKNIAINIAALKNIAIDIASEKILLGSFV